MADRDYRRAKRNPSPDLQFGPSRPISPHGGIERVGVICERCGRLLNRATGRCVCDDYGGNAPPPIATTHPLSDTTASPSESEAAAPSLVSAPSQVGAPAPLTKAEAMALLDFSNNPVRLPPRPMVSAPPEEPTPPPRLPGAPLGALRMAKSNGAKVDLVIYEGCVVLASRGAPDNLTATQLVAQHSASRMIEDATVVDVVVREDALSGGATLALRNGDTLALTWPGRRNRGVSAENLFADAFPRKVDQGSTPVTARTVKAMAVLGGLGLLVVAAWIGVSTLLAKDTPPPPPPAPAVTVPPAEQAARAELESACGMWTSFAQGLAAGDRPDPARLRPLVDALKPRLDAATSAVAAYGPARDEAAYLQDYVRRPADAIARESSGRVTYAVSTISAACARAAAPPSS